MSSDQSQPISTRVRQLNQLILGKTQISGLYNHALHRDGLVDAFCALYEECNNEILKKNPLVSAFVKKMEAVINFLNGMRVTLSDFEVKTVIGRGNFGDVQVVREKATGYIFAMKTLRKAETLAHHCVAFYEEERDIMAKSTSPWITKLEYAFQDSMNLYLVMEFHPGGDMLSLMKRNNVLSEDVAVFYVAELVLAIHSVHEMGYAHRDIKPDNILLDVTGHIKLADFGSASKLNNAKVTSRMPVGTPEYIAPEVLESVNGNSSMNSYGTECDFWSLGIIAYEMVFGVTPFAHEKLIVVYNRISNFKTTLSFPKETTHASDNYVNLIQNLITNANTRLNYKQLLDHNLFEEINWHNIRESSPPYIPIVNSLDDTSNFDDFDEDVAPSIGEFQQKVGFSGKNLPFIGFTYTTPLTVSSERSLSLNSSTNSPVSSYFELPCSQPEKVISNLHKTMAELNERNQNIASENAKLQGQLKARKDAQQYDVYRLKEEVSQLREQIRELNNIMKLEREQRCIVEEKSLAVIRFMKKLPQSRRNLLNINKSNRRSLVTQLDDALLEINSVTEESEYETCDERVSPCPTIEDLQEKNRLESELNLAEEKSQELERNLEKVKNENLDLVKLVSSLENENESLQEELTESAAKEMREFVNLEHQLSQDNIISDLRNELKSERERTADLEQRNLELSEENSELKERMENSLPKTRQFEFRKLSPPTDKDFEEESLENVKIDLRIALREKKKAEESVSYWRENNKELRLKVNDLEKNLENANKEIENLKVENKKLMETVAEKEKEIVEKTTSFEAHREINEQYSKKNKIQEEAEKQNKILRNKSLHETLEKNKLMSNLENIKLKLDDKIKECEDLKSTVSRLKQHCVKMEADLDKFQLLVENEDKDLDDAYSKIIVLKDQVKKKDEEWKILNSRSIDDSNLKKELELRIAELESELDAIQSLQDTEVKSLYNEKNNQNKLVLELQAYNDRLESDMSELEKLNKETEQKTKCIEEELLLIKEEAARHITQISSLKASNQQLSQALKNAQNDVIEEERLIEVVKNDFDDAEEKNRKEILKLQQTVSQQTKLIDLLQNKIENAEKKRKGFSQLFTKRENISNLTPSREMAISQEKMKCRRLQDQLSQARAQNMALQQELNIRTPKLVKKEVAVPMSPTSRAMHTALMSSPCHEKDGNSPYLVTEETSSKFGHLQGMKHKIPHRFTEAVTMKATKCSACLNSIHFGRKAMKCQECLAICHMKCATSLPDTCGLPTGLVQHYREAYEAPSLPDVDDCSNSEKTRPEGWMKVTTNRQQRWEKRYLRVIGSSLYIFLDSETTLTDKAIDEMDFYTTTGEIMVISAVSASELGNAASSDLLFVLKIEYRPSTTCWPPRHLYLMANSFSEKQMWVSALEDLAIENKTNFDNSTEDKLHGNTVLALKGENCLEVQCTYVFDENILLLGAKEGVFVASMTGDTGSLKHKIEGFSSVYQIGCIPNSGLVIVIVGEERDLCSLKSKDLAACVKHEKSSFELQAIGGLKSCHLFQIMQAKNDDDCSLLCAATADTIVLFKLGWMTDSFTVRKVIKTKETCCCIHFTTNSIILGCDKFYELDLQTLTIEEFLDRADQSLSAFFFTVSHSQSFPVSIFNISPDGKADEYLVCFHELGVFVDEYGQRTRSEDLIWTRLPLAFAYRLPYLFVLHFTSLKVIEILPSDGNAIGLQAIMEVNNPQFLGYTGIPGGIYISSSQGDNNKILSVYGSKLLQNSLQNNMNGDDQITSSSKPNSMETDENEELEFSFTDSILHSLDDETVVSFKSASDGL